MVALMRTLSASRKETMNHVATADPGMPKPVLGEFCTVCLKDFPIFPLKKKKIIKFLHKKTQFFAIQYIFFNGKL